MDPIAVDVRSASAVKALKATREAEAAGLQELAKIATELERS